MHNRIPSRRRQGASQGNPPGRQGHTAPQGDTRQRASRVASRVPHERDESADSQGASEPSGPRMAQAAREDIERGVVDTDKGPALDQAYDKVREGTPDPDKKLSP